MSQMPYIHICWYVLTVYGLSNDQPNVGSIEQLITIAHENLAHFLLSMVTVKTASSAEWTKLNGIGFDNYVRI